jgi:hypothetical protein
VCVCPCGCVCVPDGTESVFLYRTVRMKRVLRLLCVRLDVRVASLPYCVEAPETDWA